MSIGKRPSEGNRGNDLSFRSKLLRGLAAIAGNTGSGGSLNQEITQLAVLNTLQNLLAENKLDFEIKSVKDANGVVFQLRGTLNEETGAFTWDYIDAEGNAYSALNQPGGPQVSVEFLNPDGLLTAIEAELLDQGITLDSSLVELQAINTNTDQLEALLTTIDTVLDNSLVQLQAINVNTDQLEALSTDIKNLLTTIDADTGNIATDVAAIEVLITTTNSLLTAIDAVIDQIQTNTLNTVNGLTTANVTLAAVQNELIALNNTASTLATEATLELVRLQLVALNTTDFATETTLASANNFLNLLLAAFNAEDFAREATQLFVRAAVEGINSKLNTLGQKASAGSLPAVLSTEQEVILNDIKTAVQNIDSDLGTGGLALETTQQAIETLITSTNALLTTIDADTSNLDVALSTRATESTLNSLLLAFNSENFAQEGTLSTINTILGNTLDVLLSSRASELTLQATNALLTTIDGVLDAIKLDTANLDVSLSSRLNTLGRKAETGSAPVVLSNEDFAALEAIRVAVQNLDVDVDGIATEVTLAAILTAFNAEDFASQTTLAALAATDFATQTTLAALLTAFNAEDFASQTTLQALLTAFNTEDFSTETTLAALLTAFNAEDFATETTLNAIKLQTDQMSFDGNSALEVSLPTGTVNSSYQVISGVGAIVIPAGNTSISCLSYGVGNCTVDTGSGPVNLASGIGLDFVAPVGKTLGSITFAGTIASSRLAITTVAN